MNIDLIKFIDSVNRNNILTCRLKRLNKQLNSKINGLKEYTGDIIFVSDKHDDIIETEDDHRCFTIMLGDIISDNLIDNNDCYAITTSNITRYVTVFKNTNELYSLIKQMIITDILTFIEFMTSYDVEYACIFNVFYEHLANNISPVLINYKNQSNESVDTSRSYKHKLTDLYILTYSWILIRHLISTEMSISKIMKRMEDILSYQNSLNGLEDRYYQVCAILTNDEKVFSIDIHKSTAMLSIIKNDKKLIESNVSIVDKKMIFDLLKDFKYTNTLISGSEHFINFENSIKDIDWTLIKQYINMSPEEKNKLRNNT